MSTKIKWVIATLSAYLFFLLYTLPAAQVIGRAPLPQNIEVSGVSGTVWNGQAQLVIVDGMPVDNVKWQLSFLPLLWGTASLDLQGGNNRQVDDISFKGEAGISLFSPQNFSADDFSLFLPSALVISQLPLPLPVDAGGRFRINIESLDYAGQCAELAGTGQWLRANIQGLGEPLELGNFDADLSCIEGDTLIRVKEPNLFGLTADARVPADLNISVKGKFKPDASLPKQVHDAAVFFGQPDADGYYQLEF